VFVFHWAEVTGNLLGIFHGVQRFDRRFATFGTLLVDEYRIRFLNMPRIAQHDVCQVNRGLRSEYRPAKIMFHQMRQVAAVVDMRM
jgi:hypothetical protein